MLDGISAGEGLIVAGDATWTDYIIVTRARVLSDGQIPEVALIARFRDANNFYWLGLGCWGHRVSISRMVNGVPEELVFNGQRSEVQYDRFYALKVTCLGDLLQLYVDDVQELEVRDPTHPQGAVGYRPYASHIQAEYIEVLEPAPPPLKHLLSIDSAPLAGFSFLLDSAAYVTPFSSEVNEGQYVVDFPANVDYQGVNYTFKSWEDGSTSSKRIINLVAPMSLLGTYAPPPPPNHTLSVNSNLSNFSITVNGAQKTVPYTESLVEGAYDIVTPSNLQVGTDTYNFSQWEDGSTSPSRSINLITDVSITSTYVLQPPPPPPKGHLEVHAFLDGAEITEDVTIAETGGIFQTPVTLELDPGSYTAKIRDLSKTADVLSEQTTRLDFLFTTPTPTPPGSLEIRAYSRTREVEAEFTLAETGWKDVTPWIHDMAVGVYHIDGSFGREKVSETAEVKSGQFMKVELHFDYPVVGYPIFRRWLPGASSRLDKRKQTGVLIWRLNRRIRRG